MRRLLGWGAVMGLLVGAALAQGNTEQALKDLEQQWTKASRTANGDAVVPLLADDFMAIDSDGAMRTKAGVVAMIKKAKWEKNEISDLKVRVYGSSAVVTGLWTGKGIDGAGKPYEGKERWADTWIKMAGGNWQCVSSASARVK